MPGLLWVLHGWFWFPFVLRGVRERRRGTYGEASVRIHPRSRLLIGLHTATSGLLYGGLLLPTAPFQPVAGGFVILASALLAWWTLRTFRSWRVQAEIGASHHLQTDGPFQYLRNPIYMAMNLLNLGTLIWWPNALVAAGLLGGMVLGDLRARAEEELLVEHFGDEARVYLRRVRRFVPGIY